MRSPLDLLLPYQRGWVEDDARFKVWVAGRQIGKSFTAACECVRACHLVPNSHWVVISAGKEQALEFMGKVRGWVAAFRIALASDTVELEEGGGDLKKAEVRLPNGSRITALSANPATARGYSANIILDEFAIHRDADELWRAIYPSITNPLRGELKIRVMSTPKGMGNRFALLAHDTSGKWSVHRTTIHDAKAAGLAVDIEALRQQAGDEDTWRQEFECAFIDSARTAFPYEVIAGCESAEATAEWDGGREGEAYFVGIDVGALKDPSVAAVYARRGGRLVLRGLVEAREMELSDQDAVFDPLVRRAARCSIDASGLGLDLAQRLRRRHGGKVMVQPVTAGWKRQALARVQRAMIDRTIAVPAGRRIREDLHAYEVAGAGETASYHAPRTDDGHSDFTSATAHALDAAAARNHGRFARLPAPGGRGRGASWQLKHERSAA